MRSILSNLAESTLTEQVLLSKTEEPYFVPEGSPLNKQLVNFQRLKQRLAFAVDEYGDIQGLVTTEDVIREIVGEFGTDPGPIGPEVADQGDGTFLVDAGANVRQLNQLMNWDLPTEGPKTLNGLIVEQLETIPDPGTTLTVAGYSIAILDTNEHAIRKVRLNVPETQAAETKLTAIGG